MTHKLCTRIQCPDCFKIPLILREEILEQRKAIEKLLAIAQKPLIVITEGQAVKKQTYEEHQSFMRGMGFRYPDDI